MTYKLLTYENYLKKASGATTALAVPAAIVSQKRRVVGAEEPSKDSPRRKRAKKNAKGDAEEEDENYEEAGAGAEPSGKAAEKEPPAPSAAPADLPAAASNGVEVVAVAPGDAQPQEHSSYQIYGGKRNRPTTALEVRRQDIVLQHLQELKVRRTRRVLRVNVVDRGVLSFVGCSSVQHTPGSVDSRGLGHAPGFQDFRQRRQGPCLSRQA